MSILQNGQIIEKYKVKYLIKENSYCETYRIEDEDGNPYFLKLYIIKNTPTKLLDEQGNVREIAMCQKIKHQNIISYINHGTLDLEEGSCQYMITVYFNGELLSDRISKEGPLAIPEATDIFKGILTGLVYLHEMQLMHNDITSSNIMLSERTGGIPELIDMGHVCTSCSGNTKFDTSDLDQRYCSTLTFASIYNERTDIFAAFAVFYEMLTGKTPWDPQPWDPKATREERIKVVRSARKKELDLDIEGLEDGLRRMLVKGLTSQSQDRYNTAKQVLNELSNPNEVPKVKRPSSDSTSRGRSRRDSDSDERVEANIEIKRGGGNGFADIAGMQELKDMLRTRVIFVLKDTERAKKYRLTPPNGMLLYGPPGCGKTFFAEKFAEESGFNFILVKASDLGSIYIHGTQGKIADLFKKAEKCKPTVLCFDEFDAFVPSRSGWGGEHQGGEVNEFLTQLNNCSKRGIFVIATSNRPDKIDPAVLRTGRIDKMVYVPMPDLEARREMFALYIKGRPCKDVDFEQLAKLSDGYVASDIAYVVNEAAMIAAFNDEEISQELLERTITHTNPSLRSEVLREYDQMREKMESYDHRNTIPRIGFK